MVNTLAQRQIYRPDIQIMRAIAVIAVVLFHAYPRIFPNGYLGVDVFFIVSGYVVTPLMRRIFEEKRVRDQTIRKRIRDFYLRRLYRLAPALSISLILCGLLLFFLGQILDQNRYIKQGITTILLLGNLGAHRFDANYFSPNPNPLLHTWSLSVEEQIYLFIPLILLVYSYLSKRKALTITAPFVWLVAISYIVFLTPKIEQSLGQMFGQSLDGWEFYSPLSRLWEFALGGCLYLATRQIRRTLRSNGMNLVILAALLIVIFTELPLNRAVATSLVSLLIVSLLRHEGMLFLPKYLKNCLEHIGNQSYSIYLYHMPVIYLAQHSPLFGAAGDSQRQFQTIIAILATFFLASVSFAQVEERFRIRNQTVLYSKSKLKLIVWTTFPVLILYFAMTFANDRNFLVDQEYGVGSTDTLNWDSTCSWHTLVKPCIYTSTTASTSVLLIGDSMAGSLSRTFVDVGREGSHNVILFARASCPFILDMTGLVGFSKEWISEDCLKHNRQISNIVKQHHISKIFYFQSASNRYFDDSDSQHSLIRGAKLSLKVLEDLHNLGLPSRDIVTLSFTPYFNAGKQSRLGYLLGERLIYSNLPSRANIFWEDNSKLLGFSYLDAYGVMCNHSQCKMKMGDNFLLQDDHHLSMVGANLIRERINTLIEE